MKYNNLIDNEDKKHIQLKIGNNIITKDNINFIEEEISIKPIDYYYTNAVARSSKVMSECRQVSKNFSFSEIEKAS